MNENTAPAVVGPDWYHAECDDPDRSGFYLEKSDAQTQVNDHGGYVTELFATTLPNGADQATILAVCAATKQELLNKEKP